MELKHAVDSVLEEGHRQASFTVKPVTTQADLNATILLFEAYAASLGIDLTFQDFANEMTSMPGKYASPAGTLLLAESPAGAIGCVGLRPFGSHGHCEMKRLYVDPKGRGLGVGKALATAVINEAKRLGYKAICLDTLPTMSSARALYESLGFRETEPYYNTPLEGTVFLELPLVQVANNTART